MAPIALLFEQHGELFKSVPVVHDVALRLPQHVDESLVVIAVQLHVLRQLRAEPEEWHIDHTAPRTRTLHRTTLR